MEPATATVRLGSRDRHLFPFFDLPTDLVLKILKEYVPVTDKSDTLCEMDEFRPYIYLENVFFPSTRALYRLADGLTSGWYADLEDTRRRLLVTVDYFDLTLTVDTFSADLRCACTNSVEEENVTNRRGMHRELHSQFPQSVVRISERDVLYYRYSYGESDLFVDFQVWVLLQTVCWCDGALKYSLIDGRCKVSSERGTLSLEFLGPEKGVRLTCLAHLSRDFGLCLCLGQGERLLLPCAFEKCRAVDSNGPFSRATCREARIVRPALTTTFKNVDSWDDCRITRKRYPRFFVNESFLALDHDLYSGYKNCVADRASYIN